MAQRIIKGTDPDDGDQVTKEMLHTLVDDASVLDLEESDLNTKVKMFKLSEPGAPADGDLWWDSTKKRLQVRHNSANNDLHGTIEMTNKSGTAMEKGQVVCFKLGPNSNEMDYCRVSADIQRVIGVVDDDSIADDASGRVRIKGLAYVRVAKIAGDATGSKFLLYPAVPGDSSVFGDLGLCRPHGGETIESSPAGLSNQGVFAHLYTNIPAGTYSLFTAIARIIK